MRDLETRDSIVEDLYETLFVEAGAGTGKTTALVARIVNLVTSGSCQVRHLAAITFTEAAAAELRDRVRTELEKATADRDPARARRALEGLDELDGAAISTLHGFAQRILGDFPLEAGLPPAIEIRDELQSGLDFDEQWKSFLDSILVSPEHQPTIARALLCGVTFDHLRSLIVVLDDNWDLLEELDPAEPALAIIDGSRLSETLHDALAHRARCTAADDRLLVHLDGLEGFARRLDEAGTELELLQLLIDAPTITSRNGNKTNWGGEVEVVRDRLSEAAAVLAEARDAVASNALERLLVQLRHFVLDSAERRRRAGQLEFHDLLVLARRLLRHSPVACAALSDRYRRLLIDEFQDTDPIQAELAVRIVAGPQGAEPGGGPPPSWWDLAFEPGRLFFVGDSKQSIYRFRRADIALFLQVRDRLAVESLSLTTNFRSVPAVLAWVNHAFGHLFGDGVDGMQPRYEALEESRPPHDDGPRPVSVLGGPKQADSVVELREAEMREIAGLATHILDEQWPVGPTCRPARLEDIVILLPTRTSLPLLQSALDDADVPYRVESSGLAYATREVRDLLSVLRAVDDPTNEVAVVAALRSPVFGCGDDDLLSWWIAGGRWDYRRSSPSPAASPDHPVLAAMTTLAGLHRERWWSDVSGLVEHVLRDLRFLELGCADHRPRDTWRRLRFVADQARAWSQGGTGDLRGFLAWVDAQAAEDARVVESLLPETDDDAVRIMTVHAAKGLQFPITVLTGLNSAAGGHRGPVVHWGPDGRPEVRVRKGIETRRFDELADREADMERYEKDRLLYVAATRARDHLVLSLWHIEGRTDPAATLWELCRQDPSLWRPVGELAGDLLPTAHPEPDHRGTVPNRSATELARSEWFREHERLLRSDERPSVVAATAVATLDAEPPGDPDPDRPPWRRGRAGTAIGRAVHAVLQTIDLETGEGLADTAAAQATAEGVPERADEIVRLVDAARGAPIVREAIEGGRYWRELYVGSPIGGATLEGFVDLLVDTDDGLVIVDYKTDASEVEALDDVVTRYRLQGAAYALAVEEVVGRPVTRCVFVFLRPDGAHERDLVDLPEARSDVLERLAVPGTAPAGGSAPDHPRP